MGVHCPTPEGHCPSYPTVPWDRWDCPWESTVPSEGPISHCPSYPTVPWDRWDCPWESTVPHLRATVRPIPLYHGTGGTVHGSPLSHLRNHISHCPSYPTVPWDRWDCPWESTVPSKGPISHCPSYPTVPWDRWNCPWESTVPSEGPIYHCPSYPTVPWDRWDCPWESTVPPEGYHIPLSVLSHSAMGQVGLSMGVHCPT